MPAKISPPMANGALIPIAVASTSGRAAMRATRRSITLCATAFG
jgi:hypothetical protein